MSQKTGLLLQPLFKMLNEIKPISKELESALVNYFTPEQISKGKNILEEKGICRDLWFLADGVLRAYHNIGRKEVTSRIMLANHIVISPGSFFTQTPSIEAIEAIDHCVLVRLAYADLQKIYAAFPELNYHTRIVTEQYFYKLEQRVYMLRNSDPMARYQHFLENYSAFLQHAQQKHIASFLNITPETLSRIRNKVRKNK